MGEWLPPRPQNGTVTIFMASLELRLKPRWQAEGKQENAIYRLYQQCRPSVLHNNEFLNRKTYTHGMCTTKIEILISIHIFPFGKTDACVSVPEKA
jgi:hypothetical protein